MSDWDAVKKRLGYEAAQKTPAEGLIGLGSGTTSEWFIRALAEKHKSSPSPIRCLATSQQSEKLAIQLGLPILPFSSWQQETIDFLVDGADCVDSSNNMIKGLGAALLREKLLAAATKKYLILVDERKVHTHLSGILPIEILPHGIPHTIQRIGLQGAIRKNVTTDNGNVIFDIHLTKPVLNPLEMHLHIKGLVGVVETGLFVNMNPEVIIGRA